MTGEIGKILSESCFNGVIFIVKGDQVILEQGFGLADHKNEIPNRSHIVYRIGSIGKQFTALSILQLVEKGKIQLEDTLYKYIPTQDFFRNITIHQLLAHSGGLPEDFKDEWDDGLHDIDLEHALNRLDEGDLVEVKPGYSNVGYAILGHLIEIISDYSYHDYLTKYIAEPLGLTNTGSDAETYLKHPDRAIGYENSREENGSFLYKLYEGAGSLIYTNIKDYYTWERSLYTERLLSEPYRKLMFTNYIKINENFGYGYGWEVHNVYHSIQQHSGYLPGFCSYTIRNSANKFMMIAISNHGKDGLNPLEKINQQLNEWMV